MALALAVLARQAPAEVGVGLRTSSAEASCTIDRQTKSAEPQTQTDLLPANLSNSTTFDLNGVTATANSTSSSSISLDTGNDTLQVTGQGTGKSTITAKNRGAGDGTAKVIQLEIGASQISYSYTLTGHLSADSATFSDSYVQLLQGGTNVVLKRAGVFSGIDNLTLNESGTIAPGSYLLVVYTSGALGPDDTEANASADFTFTLKPIGAPTPTPTPTPKATPIRWNNAAGGSFHTGENWDPQQVPGSNDTAIFGLANTYSVNVGTANTERLEIRNGDVTFTNANYKVGSTSFSPSGILLDNSKLTLPGGATLEGVHALIGQSAAARVNVINLANFNLTGSLQVGGSGNGILSITDGGLVTSGEGRIGNGAGGGSVTISGANTGWVSGNLSVGFSGPGTLTLSSQGSVRSDNAFVGFGTGDNGLVEVTGAGSTWTVSQSLRVGEQGPGTVKVLDGGHVDCKSDVFLGTGSIGSLLVQGFAGTTKSLLDAQGLSVGSTDVGTLEIQSGGVVRASSIVAGAGGKGIGVITVAGKSSLGPSLLNSLSGIGIGAFGDGTLVIKEDASAVCDFATVGSIDRNGLAVLGVNNAPGSPASWTINGDLQVGTAGSGDPGTGTISLRNAAHVSVAQKLTIFPNGSLCGNGTYSASMVENNGTVCPGNSAGNLTIEGAFTQTASGKTLMELGGAAPGEFDVLHVTGNTTLAGTLEIRSLNNFLPLAGQTFELFQFDGAIVGAFDQIMFPDFQPGFDFRAEQIAAGFRITALNDALAATALLNISTRARVGTGDDVLIAGFIVQGSEPKTVILRGMGPSLELAGSPVPGRLGDTTLELHGSGGSLIFANDNWVDSPQKQQIIDSTIPPPNDLESAIVATLDPGDYTAILRGANDKSGIGVVEVYDIGQKQSVNMTNISTRGKVQNGDDVMIAGFIARGTTHVLTRALGPSLTASGVAGALTDPRLEVFDANGAVLVANDNWKESQQAEIEATTISPGNDMEAAAALSLPGGAYTVIVRGVSGTEGIALVELYKL